MSKKSGATPDNFRSFFFRPSLRSSAFRSYSWWICSTLKESVTIVTKIFCLRLCWSATVWACWRPSLLQSDLDQIWAEAKVSIVLGFWLSLMPMPDLQTTSQSPLSLSVVLYFLFLKLVWWQGLICVRMTVGRMAVGRVIVGRMTVGRMTVVRMTVGRRMWGGECGEDDCGEDDCGEEMPEPQTTSQSPSFCSCCQSSQVSFLLSGATSSNSNSLRRFLDVSKLAVECMKGW